jgi:hypothetical protein
MDKTLFVMAIVSYKRHAQFPDNLEHLDCEYEGGAAVIIAESMEEARLLLQTKKDLEGYQKREVYFIGKDAPIPLNNEIGIHYRLMETFHVTGESRIVCDESWEG